MPVPFLVRQLENIAQQNIAQAQQQQVAQLALQNFIAKQQFQQQQEREQEQQFINQMVPALIGYAGLLNQSGKAEEAQNVLSSILSLQTGGIKGLQLKKSLEPQPKKIKEKRARAELEDLTEELFPGSTFAELEKEEKAQVSKELATRKKESRFPELGLRILDAYDREPNVRSFRELKDSINQMAEVLKGGIERKDFAFADQAAIVMFNKIIDPTSVVREGEFSRTTQFSRWTERLRAMAEKVKIGGQLTNKERQELLDTSYDMLTAAYKVTSSRTQTFIKRGQKFGLNPEDFDPVGEISLPEKPVLPIIKQLTPDEARKMRSK